MNWSHLCDYFEPSQNNHINVDIMTILGIIVEMFQWYNAQSYNVYAE